MAEINLLKDELGKERGFSFKDSGRRGLTFLYVTIGLLVLEGAFYGWFSYNQKNLENQMATLDMESAKAEQTLPALRPKLAEAISNQRQLKKYPNSPWSKNCVAKSFSGA